MSDLVNHPKHYNSHPSGIECIVIAEAMNFNLGNAVKYIWRSGDKGHSVQDLSKARWYLDREIQRLTRGEQALLRMREEPEATKATDLSKVSRSRDGRLAGKKKAT